MDGDDSTDLGTTGDEAGANPDDNGAEDLTVIKGIGPAVEAKLRGFGITSLAALAAADPDALAAKLKVSQPISTTRVKGWVEVAQERTAGRT
ncbi:MAG: helix-hairpin-helix domain-containing protein [Alphaproteobacteria bacterium]